MTIDNTVLRVPHDLGSYAIKLIHPKVTTELRRRATSGNSVDTTMPFVRLTSAIELGSDVSVRTKGRITTPGRYFSIGLHATQTYVTGSQFGNVALLESDKLSNYNNPFESVYNIFNSTGTETGPVIGTIRQASGVTVKNVLVRAKTDPSADGQTSTIATSNLYASPPGITSVNIERKNNGQVNSAQVEMVIPTLAQFEALAEIFFIPGVTMILEWGSLSSRIKEGLKMLPWDNLSSIDNILMKNSGFGPTALQIFNDYTYPSKGRYCFIIGKLASFDAKMNNNGEFTLSIKLIGPGEQNFAYSIYETVSAVLQESDIVQATAAGTIETYFAENGDFDTLMANPLQAGNEWSSHIIKIGKTESTGNPAPTASGTDDEAGQKAAREEQQNSPTFLSELGENQDAVFVSWKFFVNVILNSARYGIHKLFREAGMADKELEQIKLLQPLSMEDDDPDEPFVGCHTYLRSTNPAVCVIYNSAAETAIRNGSSPWKAAVGDTHLSKTAANNPARFEVLGSFAQGTTNDKGLLSKGVWLNASAIKQSLMSSRTLHEGIGNLLNRMNAAVNGYWELTLDYETQEVTFETQQQPEPTGIDNFMVVDRKYRGVLDRLRDGNIYKFNKFFNPSTRVGSELIDFTVGLNTPPMLMTQLAFSRPANSETTRGVVVGGFDSSMQTLFEPVEPEGLSLMDIDIVRRKIRGEKTTSTLAGRPNEAAGARGANSTTQNAVIKGQATRTTEAKPLPTLQQLAEKKSYADNEKMAQATQAQIDEREKRKKELLASTDNPQPTTAVPPKTATPTPPTPKDLNGKLVTIVTPKVMVGSEAAIVVKLDSGIVVKRIGSRNWRNNNPGNINYGEIAKRAGAIGSDGRFAVFPDYASGREAKRNLLFESNIKVGAAQITYKNSSIADAIATYSPANDGNDVQRYVASVVSAVTGATRDTILKNLSKEQQQAMLTAMEKVEGYKVGKIEIEPGSDTPVVAATPAPAAAATIGKLTNQEEIDKLTKEIDALTNNRNAFANIIGPGKRLELASNKFPHLRPAFTLIEFAPHLMMRKINEEPTVDIKVKNNYEVNNNLKYSLNPLEANLVLPGISGIRIGELVRLGRMPKRLFEDRGAWQILGITDNITPDAGWISTLRCRFMPLPPVIVKNLKDI